MNCGIKFKDLNLDVRNSSKLVDVKGPEISNVGDGVPYTYEGKSKKYFTDAILNQATDPNDLNTQIRFFRLLKLDTLADEWERSTGKRLYIETKCTAGSHKRGEIMRDFEKWRGVLAIGHPLVIFFWSHNSLIVASINADSEGATCIFLFCLSSIYHHYLPLLLLSHSLLSSNFLLHVDSVLTYHRGFFWPLIEGETEESAASRVVKYLLQLKEDFAKGDGKKAEFDFFSTLFLAVCFT